jgi:hypothetical protein
MARRLSSRRLLWLFSVLPRTSFTVQFCSLSRPLTYLSPFHEFERVHRSIVSGQDFEASPVSRLADRNVFGSQLPHYGRLLSAPLSALKQEVRDNLSSATAPPASSAFDFPDPHRVNAGDGLV